MHERGAPLSWKLGAGLLVGGVLVVLLGVMFLGSQVGGILSTVGGPVGGPGTVVGTGGEGSDGSGDGGTGSDSGDGGTGSGGGGDVDTTAFVDAARPDLLVIKTGEISIETAAVGAAIDGVTRRILAMGGYVSASERARDGGDRATVTFRVPADRWEDALAAARGVGEKVLDEHTGTEDVTGEVVDLRARIRNLEATEQAFQAIVARATVIKDILAVQAELTKVRGEIEQLTAAATSLQERAAWSTLKVLVSTPAAIATPAPEPSEPAYDAGAEVEAATDQFVDNAELLTSAGIWFAIVWVPLLGLLALGGLVAYVVVRRVTRVLAAEPATSGSDARA